MQVGINSQTIRIETNGKITDYHITDGMSSSHLMGMIAQNANSYIDSYIKLYDSVDVSNLKDPLTWGVEGKDKFEDINFVNVDTCIVESNDNTDRYSGLSYTKTPYTYVVQRRPIQQSKPRKSNNDKHNEDAFRKLFTGE